MQYALYAKLKMAARTLVYSRILLMLFVGICVKKKCFITSECWSLSLHGNCTNLEEETHIFQSLWLVKEKNFTRSVSNNCCFTFLILLLSGDIERCPGPVRSMPDLENLCSRKGLKILHQNTQGLLANFDQVKIILETFKNVDILTLSETHITSDNNSIFNIPGYSFISRRRNAGTGGGVACYISHKLNWVRREDLEMNDLEIMWIEIVPKKSKSFLIACLYRPPDTSLYLPKNFNDKLKETLNIAITDCKEVILLGDVNVNYLDKANNRCFKEVLELVGMKQIITKPTRITKESQTLIDIIATNCSSTISFSDVILTSIGDHEMVGCSRKFNHLKFNPQTITTRNFDL